MKDLADVKWICPVCGKENVLHVHKADVRLPIMSNADKIRAMNDEDLSYILAWPCVAEAPWCREVNCPYIGEDPVPCNKCALIWLKEEAEK